jgi:hypothetical protein
MPEKPLKPAKKPGAWSAVRQNLAPWEKPALFALIKDLYDASAANRNFIQARCNAEEGGPALESYRKQVIEPFYPARGESKLKLGEARKAIREYRKATGNLPGTIELLLTYSETGAQFTNEYGDIDDRFYDSLCSALDELAALVMKVEGAWESVSERMEKLARVTNGMGWGYGDHVNGVVDDLRNHFSND